VKAPIVSAQDREPTRAQLLGEENAHGNNV
jgi:hypothetical protein